MGGAQDGLQTPEVESVDPSLLPTSRFLRQGLGIRRGGKTVLRTQPRTASKGTRRAGICLVLHPTRGHSACTGGLGHLSLAVSLGDSPAHDELNGVCADAVQSESQGHGYRTKPTGRKVTSWSQVKVITHITKHYFIYGCRKTSQQL